MKLFIYYISVFLLAIIVMTAWSAPSYLLKPYIPKQITIDKLAGKIISGQAQKITMLANQIPDIKQNLLLKQLDWRLQPLSLFLLKAAVMITIDSEQGKLSSNIIYHLLDGRLSADNINGQLNIQHLIKLSGNELPVTGKLTIQDGQVEYQSTQLDALSGQITLDNLVILEQFIGRVMIEATFNKKKKNIQFQLKSHPSNAKISISGAITLGLDGQYQVNMRLGANKQTPTSLKDALSLLGTQSGEDRVVKLTGKL